MNTYSVVVKFSDIRTNIKANNTREAKRIIKQRIKDGKLKPRLLPERWCGTGENPCVDEV